MSIAQAIARLIEPWHITPEAHIAILCAFKRAEDANWSMPEKGNEKKRDRFPTERSGGTAIVQIDGALALRPSPIEEAYYGIVSMDKLMAHLDELAVDQSVSSVVLHVTSPGGTANGSAELAAKTRALNERKPVVAFADSQMASAAYHFGSQSSAVIAAPSASVGSIGTLINWLDASKYYEAIGFKLDVIKNQDSPLKGIHPAVPLTKDQRAYMQERVDQLAASFKEDVKKGRPGIKKEAMLGQTLFGQSAVSTGLVDELGDLPRAVATAQALARWKSNRG